MTTRAPALRMGIVLVGEFSAGDIATARRTSKSMGDAPVVALAAADASASALRSAVERLDADWVCVVTGPAGLRLEGLVAATRALGASDAAAGLYSDTRVRDGGYEDGILRRPVLSPERLRCQYYLGPAVIYRREHLVATPLVEVATVYGYLYDAALRATLAKLEILHQTVPLVEQRGDREPLLGSSELDDVRELLLSYLGRSGGGEVRAVGADGVHDTRRRVVDEPLVSIVIPTRAVHVPTSTGPRCFVIDAVRDIVEHSTYTSLEFVIVADSVAEVEVIERLREIVGERLRLVSWDKPFNFSDKVNLGVVHARGEYVLILNDDVAVLTPGWIESMLALAQLPRAGMAGAMLYYEDDTIQHAGHAYFDDEASHIGLDRRRGDSGPLDGYRVEREVAGVTAACALMPRAVFFEAGGFTGLLPGNFNDVDLCMKVTYLGYDIYWTPHAELYHFESKTRNPTVHSFEVAVNWGRWGHRMHDPKYWPYPLDRQPLG
ncbi:glycosyltransferase family 2 protein [Agromyces bauzanensis]